MLYFVPGSALNSRQNKASPGLSTFQRHSAYTHQVLELGLHVVLADSASVSVQIATCDVTASIMRMVYDKFAAGYLFFIITLHYII